MKKQPELIWGQMALGQSPSQGECSTCQSFQSWHCGHHCWVRRTGGTICRRQGGKARDGNPQGSFSSPLDTKHTFPYYSLSCELSK